MDTMNSWFHILSFPFLAAFGLATILLGIQILFLVPLTLAYEIWKKRKLMVLSSSFYQGRVSVIVPAYNEEKTLRPCLESILGSDYPNLEVIVVNDGSTDGTEESIQELIRSQKVIYIHQPNSGKARALNRGASTAKGEVILYTDADSFFLANSIRLMVQWFNDPTIDAVCGNDTPFSARTPLQKVLAVTSHIGTGFVRRALSVLGVLPIITGNMGAIRKTVFHEIGGFQQVWGEDLDITFRLHKAGKKIIFDPSPVIRADCPADLSALWRQRIRWVRSYLKISGMHRNLFFSKKAFPFSFYLPLNYFSQIIVPVLQILSIPLFFQLMLSGGGSALWWITLLIYLGLFTFIVVAVYSIFLDRDWKTLVYLPVAVSLIVPLSYFYNFVVAASIWKEMSGKKEQWVKIERLPTGLLNRFGGAGLALIGFLLFILFFTIRPSVSTFYVQNGSEIEITRRYYPESKGEIAIATHFDAWDNWNQAVTGFFKNKDAHGVSTIALGAGRPEWTYFRWQDHPEAWSSTQKNERVDLLGDSAAAFKKRNFQTVAIIDLYAPGFIKKNPLKAAVRFDGVRSPEQVSFTELVNGEYGQQVIEMAKFLAHNYPVKAIALTEISYKSFCFDDHCLLSYRRTTGNKSWPKSPDGSVDRDDPSIWEWRSAKMEKFIERIAKAVHQEGKELYVDVPVSWADFSRHGKDSGLDYTRILKHADRIVVWNYFDIENLKPDVSLALAKDLRNNFPPEKVMVSIGLWGNTRTVNSEEFKIALNATLKGGISNIWITPNHLMSSAHWNALTDVLGKPLPKVASTQ